MRGLINFLAALSWSRGHVILTCRHRSLLKASRHKFSEIELQPEFVIPDIKCYVEQKIRDKLKLHKLKDKILASVVDHSRGNFLHARLLVEDLETAQTLNQQRQKMALFAKHLPEEYRRIFKESDKSLTQDERRRRDNILRLLVASKRPLTAPEISLLESLEPSKDRTDPDDAEFEPSKEIERLCHPLVQAFDKKCESSTDKCAEIPSDEDTPFVDNDKLIAFINDSAKTYLLQHEGFTAADSNLYLALKCLMILNLLQYRDPKEAARLLQSHILRSDEQANLEDQSVYIYAVLYFHEHVIAVANPPEELLFRLGRFLQGIQLVTWSEHLFDLRKGFGFGAHTAVYNDLSRWKKLLPESVHDEIPLDDFFETPHRHLALILKDMSENPILQYLPQYRIAQYLNAVGQSTEDWQRAFDTNVAVVDAITELRGREDPLTLRFRSDLLRSYFWQKRFAEALDQYLEISKLQRRFVGDQKPDLYLTLWLLGVAYHCLNRFAEALDAFVEAAEGFERLNGNQSREYLLVQFYRGHTLEQLGRLDDAFKPYVSVSEILGPIVGERNGFVGMSRTAQGAILRKQRKYREAEGELLLGWGARTQIFTININTCFDAAVQLALLYRDRGDHLKCLQLLDTISHSTICQYDFERSCQIVHIRALVELDQGNYQDAKKRLLAVLSQATGSHRAQNNRELLWVRLTLSEAMRRHGEIREAEMQFTGLLTVADHDDSDSDDLSDEPEPPRQLRIAEEALKLVRRAKLDEADDLLRRERLRWVRFEDFWILGEGGPVTDTACIAEIRH